MLQRREARREAWLAVGSVLAWFACTAWMRPLLLPDEGRYVAVAWHMLASSDWLTPRLDGLPFFHKPPLFYWLSAASMAVFGPHPAAARVPSIIGATLAASALWLLIRRCSDGSRARAAVLVLAVQPMFFVGAQFANLDMLVAGCISASIAAIAVSVVGLEAGQPHRAALAAGYLLAALGLLAKGLIGVVLPWLVLATWIVLRGRWASLRVLTWAPGWALVALLAGPWFVAMHRLHPGFLNYFFVVQHFSRFAGSGFNNAQPWWFLPAVLAGFAGPWLPWLAGLARRPSSGPPSIGPLRLLMAAWLVVVVAFFSLPESKLVGYVLPAWPPLAALIGDAARTLQPTRPLARRGWFAAAAVAALVGLAGVTTLAVTSLRSTAQLARALHAQRAEGQPVVMVGTYRYDVAFYARLVDPVLVVEDWADPRLRSRDNWRKELVDAADFDPAARQRTLVAPQALAGILCQHPRSWLITEAALPAHLALPIGARRVFAQRDAVLWELDLAVPSASEALGCPRRPSDGPGGRS